MNYVKTERFINTNDFNAIVSLGNKCPTASLLRELNIYKESLPFDYIPTKPSLILKYLQYPNEFYPMRSNVENKDNVWFGHFDINDNYNTTIRTFKRRFTRLFELLETKQKILFVYTSEADVYNEMNNRYNDNYGELLKIITYVKEKYKYDNFTLLCVHTNKTFDDNPNMINYTINVPEQYLSDDLSTHNKETTSAYRNVLKQLFSEIFQINPKT